MNPKAPPRVGGLVLALIAVLAVMGYGLWRASAGRGAAPASRVNEGTADSAPATGASAPDRPANVPATAGARSADAAPLGSGAPTPKDPGAATTPPRQMDEGHLMARLRAIEDSAPAAAVTLAREGNRRFPDSADAPERTSILIHALVATDRGSEARGEAEQMVNHYPDSAWVREVERFTGAHRHRNVSVNDAGQLIFR